MRQMTLGFIAVGAAFVALAILSGGKVSADTPVSVLDADEVVLLLPISPSSDRIVSDLHHALRDLSRQTRDSRIAAALERLEADDDLLAEVAATPVEMFDNRKAAATATAIYDIQLGPEQVIVTVITIELVPAYGSTAASREHEDGHALINETIAGRCATDALRTSVASGLQGKPLIDSMVALISAAGDPVHDTYHHYVRNARYGQHLNAADQALQDVPGCNF